MTTSNIMRALIALARLTACINNLVKIMRKILKNLKEKKLLMTGLSPHFKIREKLRQTDENEHRRRVKYHSLEEVVPPKTREERSTGDSE